jgi:hypothetical protein
VDITELLGKNERDIVDDATDSLIGLHLRHYDSVNAERIRERIETLFGITRECLLTKHVSPMLKYAETIAQQRFFSGFSLREVQAAFHSLEESIWARILEQMRPDEYSEAIGLVNTALRIGKESVARIFFSNVSRKTVGSLDMTAQFSGIEKA